MNAIFQLLNPNNTITVNRPLAHAVGLNEAVIYGTLVSKYYYYSERGMLDNGWFYSTAPDLQESTALSEKQQKRCIDNLVKTGLIKCELRGMPAKRSFYIVEDLDLLQSLLSAGEEALKRIKPSAAESYERKRKPSTEPDENTQRMTDFLTAAFGGTMPVPVQTSDDNSEIPHNEAVSPCSDKRAEQAPPKCNSLLRQKGGASSDETANQHFIKSNINNLNIINPSISKNTQSSNNFADENPIDRIDRNVQKHNSFSQNRSAYAQIIRNNIEYDFLAEKEKPEVDELVEIMLDVVCSTADSIRVNGEDVPTDTVRSRFLKLNSEHIGYVRLALERNTTKVRNIRSYLITALYNAPSTMDNFYRSEVNHDMYGQK